MPSISSGHGSDETPLLRPRMSELDSVRGIAIMMVLFYHGFASRQSVDSFSGLAKLVVRLASTGWMGVNLFFALSGFLITGILLDSKYHPQFYRRFYLRRALRILPAYYGLLLLLALLGRFGLQGTNVSWPFLGLSAVYLANVTVLFGVPLQFGVLWSLAVEEHFYLIWPLIVRNVTRRALGMVALAIAVAASLARAVAWHLGYDCFAHYTWMVADGLAYGSMLAVLMRGPLGNRKSLTLISFVTVLVCAILLVPDLAFHRPLAGGSFHITVLNLLCTAAICVALFIGTSGWSSLAHQGVLNFFGEISYGLYLLHMLVFNVFDNLQHELFPHIPFFKGNFEVTVVRFLISSSLAVGLAFLSRRYFEEPFLRLRDRVRQNATGTVGEATATTA